MSLKYSADNIKKKIYKLYKMTIKQRSEREYIEKKNTIKKRKKIYYKEEIYYKRYIWNKNI